MASTDSEGLTYRARLQIAIQAAVDHWDVPVDKRPWVVEQLLDALASAKSPRWKIRAVEALAALADRPVKHLMEAIDRELAAARLEIERLKIEAASDPGERLSDGARLGGDGQPIDP